MKEYFDKLLVDSLKDKGIDISDPDYKKATAYQKESLILISAPDGMITTKEYIERYLLSEKSLGEPCKSIYEMGNPYNAGLLEP